MTKSPSEHMAVTRSGHSFVVEAPISPVVLGHAISLTLSFLDGRKTVKWFETAGHKARLQRTIRYPASSEFQVAVASTALALVEQV